MAVNTHIVDHPLDARAELLDGARGERLRHESPQPGVIGRIEVEEGAAEHRVGLLLGAPDDDLGTGAAFVYVRDGTTWSLAAYLKAVDADPDYELPHYNLGVLNELYFQRLDIALEHYENYQALHGEDKQVDKWITDLTRRVAASQRTANVAE